MMTSVHKVFIGQWLCSITLFLETAMVGVTDQQVFVRHEYLV